MPHFGADQACPVTEAMKHLQELCVGFVHDVGRGSTTQLPDDVVIQDHGRLRAPTPLEAASQRFRAKAVVVVTGSLPIPPASRGVTSMFGQFLTLPWFAGLPRKRTGPASAANSRLAYPRATKPVHRMTT